MIHDLGSYRIVKTPVFVFPAELAWSQMVFLLVTWKLLDLNRVTSHDSKTLKNRETFEKKKKTKIEN